MKHLIIIIGIVLLCVMPVVAQETTPEVPLDETLDSAPDYVTYDRLISILRYGAEEPLYGTIFFPVFRPETIRGDLVPQEDVVNFVIDTIDRQFDDRLSTVIIEAQQQTMEDVPEVDIDESDWLTIGVAVALALVVVFGGVLAVLYNRLPVWLQNVIKPVSISFTDAFVARVLNDGIPQNDAMAIAFRDVVYEFFGEVPPDTMPTPVPPDDTPTPPATDEVIVNPSKAHFAGVSEHRLPLPPNSADRWQVVGAGWQPTARYFTDTGLELPPFINRNQIVGTNKARLKIEVADIAGDFGLQSTQPLDAGKYYAIRQRGYLRGNLKDGADAQNVGLGLLVTVDGAVFEGRVQAFPVLDGRYEVFWYVYTPDSVVVEFETFLRLRYAVLGAESFMEVESIEVIELSEATPDNATLTLDGAG